MDRTIKAAVLGATGYTGSELIYILSSHPNVELVFLGSDKSKRLDIESLHKDFSTKNLPYVKPYKEIELSNVDVVFTSLPHNVSHEWVKENFNKSKIIDLSADFRLNNSKIYKENYLNEHSCPELLNKFIYGLSEINSKIIANTDYVAVPGCYPTSILLPLIPLIKNKLINTNNIIIDSKSGYSGAGKNFDKKNIYSNNELNFYNYNTNNHRHICEIYQELTKHTESEINFSFNPHLLPIFRGMMSTIYCDLSKDSNQEDILDSLSNYYSNSSFVKIIKDDSKNDFFSAQNTNNCLIRLLKHYDSSKIIISSVIDNLLKGSSGQAVQCMNLMFDLKDSKGLENLKSV